MQITRFGSFSAIIERYLSHYCMREGKANSCSLPDYLRTCTSDRFLVRALLTQKHLLRREKTALSLSSMSSQRQAGR
jgi:hypothetical protein